MSSESTPISLTQFADAIKELPLSAVYAKVHELQNSIVHLHRSNNELRAFISESHDHGSDKQELETYISENEGVICSMEERIALLKAELESRNQIWAEARDATGAQADVDRVAVATNSMGRVHTDSQAVGPSAYRARRPSASEASGSADSENEENGVYL